MIKLRTDEKGISLIELLAGVFIASLISIMIFSILNIAIKTSERVSAEEEIRDEADIILGNFLESIFLTKESEIKDFKKQGSTSYILLKNNQKIGFEENKVLYTLKNSNNSVEQIRQEEIIPLNPKISILETSSINELEAGRYEIKLYLKHADLKEAVETRSQIGIIKDTTKGKEDD